MSKSDAIVRIETRLPVMSVRSLVPQHLLRALQVEVKARTNLFEVGIRRNSARLPTPEPNGGLLERRMVPYATILRHKGGLDSDRGCSKGYFSFLSPPAPEPPSSAFRFSSDSSPPPPA
ncbi:hypothetical protein N7471_000887 [Penicillium samsonianum]|uniref:uncharacterized protein n=1 Tax=Penicillium samsonianum TaxID=1882272 RepID=UPI0025478BF0|nr:uncharacterized protein N7471_000887 [Penicillium samsonianum]KAJ6149688.1 hypothetical protein N7471_000887 [Penicillium samsonianum]